MKNAIRRCQDREGIEELLREIEWRSQDKSDADLEGVLTSF